MQKIVPFKKEIFFKTDISEITSISLEHTLNINGLQIDGNFVISGDYKINDADTVPTDFYYDLPFVLDIDKKYNIDNASIDIDDFYYEVKGNVLEVNIDVLIDNILEERCIEEEVEEKVLEEKIDEKEEIKEIENTGYKSYTVYIVREGDTLETILEKYNVTKDEIIEYNDVSQLKLGDKIIIPC